MTSGILQEMTIEDVKAFGAEVVVLGIGSVEPHGPALPYGTDYFQCEGIVRSAIVRANERGARALMYPTLPIGNNVNFKGFPFACRIGVRTLMQVVLDIVEALEADGIRKIVLYNNHGGNTDALRAALRDHYDRCPSTGGAFVCLTSSASAGPARSKFVEHPSDHAGESETSSVMHLCPELVREDRIADFPFGQLTVGALGDQGVYFVRPWHLYVPAAAGGDARKASAAKGRGLVDAGAAYLAKLLVELSAAKWTENFPYK